MPVQRLPPENVDVPSIPGITSQQIMWHANASDAQVTITRVTMEPGTVSRRHTHPLSEQTCVVEQRTTTRLLADGETQVITAGEVLRMLAAVRKRG